MSFSKNIPVAKHLYGLDALRTIAALFVFLHHLAMAYFYTSEKNNEFSSIFKNIYFFFIYYAGGIGVNLFFTLSGFLMIHLALIEAADRGSIDVVSFLKRRVKRLFPAYFFALVVILLLVIVFKVHLLQCINVLFYFTFWANYDLYRAYQYCTDVYKFPFIQAWSLSVEVHFYLFCACIFIFFRARRKYVLFIALCALLIVSLAYRFIYRADSTFIYLDSLCGGIYFAVGGLAALLYHEAKAKVMFEKIELFVNWFYFALLTGIVYLLFFLPTISVGIKNIIFTSMASVFYALIILSQINYPNHSFFLGGTWLEKTGRYSYKFYLWHVVGIQFFVAICQNV
jgi:peptidoglycan/LPS O-acetylase OafA/YrhL